MKDHKKVAEAIILILDEYGRKINSVEYGLPIDQDTKDFNDKRPKEMIELLLPILTSEYGEGDVTNEVLKQKLRIIIRNILQMETTLEIQKNLLSAPGDTIQETIDAIGMSQAELAERLGRPKEKINDVIKGREPISTETAFRLEKVLGIPASFWMNREKEYRKLISQTIKEHLNQRP